MNMVKEIANVLVIGGGGVGTIASLNLVAGQKACVTLVLRSNYKKVQRDGFTIRSIDHGSLQSWRPDAVVNRVPDIASDPSVHFDYIVCCTKSIPEVQPSLAEIINPAVTHGQTVIVLIQNGLNIEKPLIAAYPANIVLSGVSFMGSHEPSHGFIQHDFDDKLIVGAFDNPHIDAKLGHNAARDFVQRYAAGGKTVCDFTGNANYSRWEKLVYNATMNPICAILRTDTARVRLSDSIECLVRPAMEEIRAAAAATGNELPETVIKKMIDMDPMDIFFQPSMCVDALKGNLMEYENLVGEPLRDGRAHGVAMPTLNVIYNMCKTLQWQLKVAREGRDEASLLADYGRL